MDHIGFDVAGSQPARQPKAVATGLISDGDARDRAPSFGRFVLPAVQSAKQRASSGLIFFSGWRAIPGTTAATSQLDWLISMTAMRVLA
jgi:hypothetical protein